MDYDDVVVGSGLSALATVLGLPATRRVLVFAGPAQERVQYYDTARSAPCAYLGLGGLGNYWHGVIATGGWQPLGGDLARVESLCRRFYPRTDIAARLGQSWLFVPWRPVRPKLEWRRLASERGGRLVMTQETVARFERAGPEIRVRAGSGIYRARRVWVCAGALHTPFLLDRSLETRVSRPTVSDHVVCYLGLIDRLECPDVAPPRVQRTPDGVWFQAHRDESGTGLFTLRPARFEFRQLDFGIRQRAIFGLPLGSIVGKMLRRVSPGLLAEALYNRTGMFAGARVQSVYAQVAVPDAHWLRDEESPVKARPEVIREATDRVRARTPWRGVRASRRQEMFIPGIHLHHSVDLQAIEAAGVNTPASTVQVVDASVREQVGPEHHSFKLMLAAADRARALCGETLAEANSG